MPVAADMVVGIAENVSKVWKEDVVHGDARSRGRVAGRVLSDVILAVFGAVQGIKKVKAAKSAKAGTTVDTAADAVKTAEVAEELRYEKYWNDVKQGKYDVPYGMTQEEYYQYLKGVDKVDDVIKRGREGLEKSGKNLKELYPQWYDANGKYTGGRNPKQLEELAIDPHKGRITKGSLIEREVILALEEKGIIEYAIRDTWGRGDYYDSILLKSYDIKSFESFPLDKFANKITSTSLLK